MRSPAHERLCWIFCILEPSPFSRFDAPPGLLDSLQESRIVFQPVVVEVKVASDYPAGNSFLTLELGAS